MLVGHRGTPNIEASNVRGVKLYLDIRDLLDGLPLELISVTPESLDFLLELEFSFAGLLLKQGDVDFGLFQITKEPPDLLVLGKAVLPQPLALLLVLLGDTFQVLDLLL